MLKLIKKKDVYMQIYYYVLLFIGCLMHGAAGPSHSLVPWKKRSKSKLETIFGEDYTEFVDAILYFKKRAVKDIADELPQDAAGQLRYLERMTGVYCSSLEFHAHRRYTLSGLQKYNRRAKRKIREKKEISENLREESPKYVERIIELCEYINFNQWHTIPLKTVLCNLQWSTLAGKQYLATQDTNKLYELIYELMFGMRRDVWAEERIDLFKQAELFLLAAPDTHMYFRPSPCYSLIDCYIAYKMYIERSECRPDFSKISKICARLTDEEFNTVLKSLRSCGTLQDGLWALAREKKLLAFAATDDPRMISLHDEGIALYERIMHLAGRAGNPEAVAKEERLSDAYKALISAVEHKMATPESAQPAQDFLLEIFRSAYVHEETKMLKPELGPFAIERILYTYGIKPNQKIMSEESPDEQTFFTLCIMQRFAHSIHSGKSKGTNSYVPLCALLDVREFEIEVQRLSALPAFKSFVYSHKKWLKSCEKSKHERPRRLGLLGRMIRKNLPIYEPSLFDRLLPALSDF